MILRVVAAERLSVMAADWFPGCPESVGQARRFVAGVLGEDRPGLDDLLTMTSEIATNAVRHTASGEPGGWFDLTVSVTGDIIRVTVADLGSPTEPGVPGQNPRELLGGGRGLAIVNGLSARWGHTGGRHGRVVWFEISAGIG